MSDNITLAQRIIGVAQIDSVRLVGSHVETSIRGPQASGTDPVQLRQDLRATRQDDGFRVVANLGISISSKDLNAPPVVSIDARFELDYSLPADTSTTDDELNAFARVNGLFNAWPYFREFVQASMARMQLPQLVLPLLRVPRRTDAVSSATGEKHLGSGDNAQPSPPPALTDPETKKESV